MVPKQNKIIDYYKAFPLNHSYSVDEMIRITLRQYIHVTNNNIQFSHSRFNRVVKLQFIKIMMYSDLQVDYSS